MKTFHIAACAGFVLAATAFADDTAPATCKTAPASVQAFNAERVVPLTGIQSTLTPRVPAALAASLTTGAEELHQVMTYNPRLNTLTVTYFVTAAKSPLPTPVSLINMSTVDTYTIGVSQVYTSCTPVPSVLFVGKVAGSPEGALGDINGALAAVGIGYTTDAKPKINNVSEIRAGLANVWSAGAEGTLAFPAATNPNPSNGGAVKIVVNPAPPASGSLQVVQNRITFDASGSAGTGLTYAWTADKNVRFQPSASVAKPTIVFNSGTGNYKITLTVTDSSGATAATTFNVTFLGRL